ncbi:MAG: hypothetical protein JW941_05010 [Candidatus Coatesbacteria bacterium]|nr:hypothetical protein [Candidatus Coatesbacteria bacterium]
MASALFYLWQGFCIMNLKWQLSALKDDYEGLSRRGDYLRQELLELSDLPTLEQYAETNGLVKPTPKEMIVLSKDKLEIDPVDDASNDE